MVQIYQIILSRRPQIKRKLKKNLVSTSIKNKVFKPNVEITNKSKRLKEVIKKKVKEEGGLTIQQFKSNPFLLKNRKVSAKAYVLITRLNAFTRAFWFKEGCATLSQEDDLQFDALRHLNSDSMRINSRPFDNVATKLLFSTFNDHSCSLAGYNLRFAKEVVPMMKQIAKHFIQHRLEGFKNDFRPTFEIIQLSFLQDSIKRPKLIKARPEYRHPLESAAFMLIDDALKLTADLLFPPPFDWPLSKRLQLNSGCALNNFQLLFDETIHTKSLLSPQSIDGFRKQKQGRREAK